MERVQWDSHHGPAINVKDHSLYDFDLPEDEAQSIYDGVAARFWEDAGELARDHGYGGVYGEGRMGGWLVPHYPSGRRVDSVEALPGERLTFQTFGAAVVELLDGCRDELRDEMADAVRERAAKAELLELGTPVRWCR